MKLSHIVGARRLCGISLECLWSAEGFRNDQVQYYWVVTFCRSLTIVRIRTWPKANIGALTRHYEPLRGKGRRGAPPVLSPAEAIKQRIESIWIAAIDIYQDESRGRP